MEILRCLNDVSITQGSVITIGSFDGIHRGHQTLLQEIERIGSTQALPSIVLTFDPHPQMLLRSKDKRPIRLLSCLAEREFFINRLFELDIFLILDFTAGFSEMSAGEFVEEILVKTLKARHIVVGYDHRFGHDRKGDVDFLKSRGEKLGFEVTSIGPIINGSKPVSSTHIRDALESDDLDAANTMLGHPYTVYGTVVRGAGRGNQMNFPTANIEPTVANKLLPAKGVYLARAIFDAEKQWGMCNIGVRPTFNDHLSHNIVEINLFRWSGDRDSLYGKKFLVEFHRKIRNEKTFKSPNELMIQLGRDRKTCKQLIKNL